MSSKEIEVKCSCNGGNPNCSKCGGWGYVRSDSPEARQQKMLSLKTDPLYYIPKEQRDSGSSRTYRGIKKVKPISKKGRNPPDTQCPYCPKKLRGTHGLATHIKQKHRDRFVEFSESETFIAGADGLSNPKSENINCPFCGIEMYTGSVYSHISTCSEQLKTKHLIKQKKIKSYMQGIDSEQLIPCPKCGSKMFRKKLSRHLMKCLGDDDIL
jgi:ssDNA-binding Zn-finger/Zn-ribbon topoisomerase 1